MALISEAMHRPTERIARAWTSDRPALGAGASRHADRPAPADEPLPARIVAKLRIEKSGRGGKTVTVVYDLPRNQPFLQELARELKRACGAGGTVMANTVEIQGDLRDRIRAALAKKGWTVKG